MTGREGSKASVGSVEDHLVLKTKSSSTLPTLPTLPSCRDSKRKTTYLSTPPGSIPAARFAGSALATTALPAST
ncbi:MAG TPA: hypothetical protein VFV98_13955, partial [Vicinamibacterales bacterium]|nr:hypothetical protein [Vicinamibacterales bacterium]